MFQIKSTMVVQTSLAAFQTCFIFKTSSADCFKLFGLNLNFGGGTSESEVHDSRNRLQYHYYVFFGPSFC